MTKQVRYFELGFTSAQQFWNEVGLPAFERFLATPNRRHAIEAAAPAWHVLEWIWHDQYRNEDAEGPKFKQFRAGHVAQCPELEWLRDVVNGSKHRGLSKKVSVQDVEHHKRWLGTFNTVPFNTLAFNETRLEETLAIVDESGQRHSFARVLTTVIDYWRGQFPTP